MRYQRFSTSVFLISSLTLLGGMLFSAAGENTPSIPTVEKNNFSLMYKNGKVWLHAKNADLNEVLKALAEKARIKVSLYEKLDEKISVDLEGVTIEECLKKISRNYALMYKKSFWGRYTVSGAVALKSRGEKSASSEKAATYTHIASLPYGKGPGEVGRIHVEGMERQGPQSFAVDDQGNIYLCDTVNGRVQVISPQGKPISQIQVGGHISDLAVDEKGNIFVLSESRGAIQQFGSDGSFKAEIPVDRALLSEKDTLAFQLGGVCLRSRDQRDCEIGRIENDMLRGTTAKKTVETGVKGGKDIFYATRKESGEGGQLTIMDAGGSVLRNVKIDVPRLASIVFLGDDGNGNIYLQVEKSKDEGRGVDLGVLKLDRDGNVVGSVENIPNVYTNWTARLLQINGKGDVYQMLPGDKGVDLNMWKWEETGGKGPAAKAEARKS